MQKTNFLFCKAQLAAIAAAVLPFFLFPAAATAAQSAHPEEASAQYTGFSMGTFIQGSFYAKDQKTADALPARFEKALFAYETLFTVHAAGPMTELNKKAGEWVVTDCRITDVMDQAKAIARASEGAFDPTIGPVVNVWKIGFGGDKVPSDAAIAEAKKHVNWRGIETERREDGTCRVKIRAGQNIDLGAIAKGWIGTALTQDLKKAGAVRAIVDLGGNVALLNSAPSGRAWRVGVQDPKADRGETLAVIEAKNESVITSGDYERYMDAEGKTYGHILSGKTGRPVPVSFSSVTIVDADGAKADGWCTALFAMGREKALAYLRENPEIRAFLLSPDEKTAWVSEGLAPRLTLHAPDVKLNILTRAASVQQ